MFIHPNTKKAVVASILAFIVIVANVYGISMVTSVNKTLDNISDVDATTAKKAFNVYVLNDDEASSLEELTDYTFYTNEADYVSELNDSLNTSVKSDDLTKIVDDLYDNKSTALLLSSSYISMLEETESYSDFESKTKVIGEVLVDLKSEAKENKEVEDITNTPFIIYISGSDTRANYLAVSRSDVNILAVVNPNTKQILLINTPRDYYVENPAGNNELDKLTHLGVYGVENSKEGLSNLYGEEINYYVQINFTGFKELIDSIGGVNINLPVGFTTTQSDPNYTFSAGNNYMNGDMALALARERHAVAGGDNDRGKNQMRIINAILTKLMSSDGMSKYLTNYGSILSSLEGTIATDISSENISALVKQELDEASTYEIFNFAVTGTGTFGNTYSMPGWNLYIMEPNTDSVKYASKLMDKILLNEKITEEDVSKTFADSPLDV